MTEADIEWLRAHRVPSTSKEDAGPFVSRIRDALINAIAIRLDATLVTLDERMAGNARALGATVAAA